MYLLEVTKRTKTKKFTFFQKHMQYFILPLIVYLQNGYEDGKDYNACVVIVNKITVVSIYISLSCFISNLSRMILLNF